jgi:hypothetical protein
MDTCSRQIANFNIAHFDVRFARSEKKQDGNSDTFIKVN